MGSLVWALRGGGGGDEGRGGRRGVDGWEYVVMRILSSEWVWVLMILARGAVRMDG